MFARILGKSVLRRKSRFAMGIVSVLMGAAVLTALLTVTISVNDKIGQEFTKYGANLVLQPKSDTIEIGLPGVGMGSVTEQRYINESDLWMLKTHQWRANIMGFAPFLYQVVTVNTSSATQEAVLAGTYFNKTVQIPQPASPEDPKEITTGVAEISPWWQVTGSWITDQNDTSSAMVGSKVAQNLGLSVGQSFKASYAGDQNGTATKTHDFTVVGIIDSGGAEDNQILVNLPVAQDLSSRPGKIHTVQISALCNKCPVEDIAAAIQEKLPYVQGTSIKQLTNVEAASLSKYGDMMSLVTGITLIASMLGIFTTMTANIVERRREIGIMKSIGAGNRNVASLFLTEAAIIGLVGSLVGFAVGVVLAQFIGLQIFATSVPINWVVLIMVVPIAIGATLLASALPVRRATRIEPAIVLRGE
ncbi:MAG: ABC transporter permease [Halobacteriota archaeon]